VILSVLGWIKEWRLPVRAVAFCAFVVLLLPAAALADTTIGFDDLAAGTTVSDQYANVGGTGQGVTFGPLPGGAGYGWKPVVRTPPVGQAQSGANVADISTAPGVEFPVPVTTGTFTVPRSHVSVYVGWLSDPLPCVNPATDNGCAVITLTAYDANGTQVGASSPATVTAGAGIHTQLSVSTPSAEIVGFKIAGNDLDDTGKQIAIDDLSFDTPSTPLPPDFTLEPASGDVRVVQGSTATGTIAIGRLSGSTGDVSFSASGLPAGVTASFAPNPANASQTVMTLSASRSAPPIYGGDVPIKVTGTPQAPSAGPRTRSATIDVGVTPAFTVGVQGSSAVDLSACTVDVPLRISRDPSFPGPVSLSVSGLPAGVQATFSPTQATFPGGQQSQTVTLALTVPSTGFTVLRRTATIHATDPPFGEEDATISVGGTCALKFDPEVLSMQVTQGTQLPVLPKRDLGNPGAPITYASIGQQAPGGTQQALAELAAFKPTVVRVYADLKYGPLDGIQVPAVLNGYRNDSNGNRVPLPGSPILPVSTPGNLSPNLEGVFGDDFLQSNYAGVYTFALPSSWERGKIQLTADLLPSQPSSLPPVASALSVDARAAAVPGQAPIWAPCTTSSCQIDNKFAISQIPFLYTFPVTIRPVAMIVTNPYDATLPDPSTVFQWAGVVTPMPLIVEPYASTIDISGEIGKDNSKGAVTTSLLSSLNDYVCEQGSPDHGWVVGVEHADIRSAQANGYCTLFESGLAFDATPVQFALVNSPEPLVSVAHELFHLFGRPHASPGCGAAVGISGKGTQPAEDWPPDQQGFLQSIGLAPPPAGYPFPYEVIPDTSTQTGTQWFDFMSYCGDVSDGDPLTGNHNKWISVHNWNAVLAEFGFSAAARDARVARARAAAAATAHTVASLQVRASVSPGGQVTIDAVEPVQAPAPKPSTSPYELVATGPSGAVVASVPMQTSFGHVDTRPPHPVLTLTGVVPAAGVTSVRIVASGTTVATRSENRFAPVVTIRRLPSFGKTNATLQWRASERGGVALEAHIDYSGDGGRRWKPIWIGPNRGSALVPSRYLFRSVNARVRVIVNDGFRAVSATSRRFHSPGASPSVQIVMPWSGTRELNDAPLGLSGQAFDDSSRMLTGKRLRWLLGRRLLGTGGRITVTGLPAGRHRIDLVATDRFGRRGRASVEVVLRASRPVFIVLSVPRSAKRRARSLSLRVASSLPATLLVRIPGLAPQRFSVGRHPRRLNVRIRRGRTTLGLKLSLRAGGLSRTVGIAVRR
jgi:hypothetical protein